MNNPLSRKDPKMSGVRASLELLGVSASTCISLWKLLTSILKNQNIQFYDCNDTDNSMSSCAIVNQNIANEVADLLGLSRDVYTTLLLNDTIVLPGKSFAKMPIQSTDTAECRRNSISKEIYKRIYSWLVKNVCNTALQTNEESDSFIGVLDLFGFQSLPKNTLYELCINYANEKLQGILDDFVFQSEVSVFQQECIELPMDTLEDLDTLPCQNLLSKNCTKFQGILPRIKEKSIYNFHDNMGKNNMGKAFVQEMKNSYTNSTKSGKIGNVHTTNSTIQKASAMFSTHAKYGNTFCITHYVGKIEYNATNFLCQNNDTNLTQIKSIMKTSKIPLLVTIFNEIYNDDKNTLAGKTLKTISTLSSTLRTTNPHFIRCINPNKIHYRPIDGLCSFNHSTVYRQLLYTGMIKVCEIKKRNFPFRMSYSSLWNDVIVPKSIHALMDPPIAKDSMPRKGVSAVCAHALPSNKVSHLGKNDIFWSLGSTKLFGKATTLHSIDQWLRWCSLNCILNWSRMRLISNSFQIFIAAQSILVLRWKKKMKDRTKHVRFHYKFFTYSVFHTKFHT
eukprot:GSMAST32.ASY1.ANO1.1609.1 assembled CDS